jgi:hypothetical protein
MEGSRWNEMNIIINDKHAGWLAADWLQMLSEWMFVAAGNATRHIHSAMTYSY